MTRNHTGTDGATERGNAFVATILLVIVMAALSSAMMATAIQDRSRTRSSTELTRTQYIAEAGIRRAIVDIDAGGAGVVGSEGTPVAFSGGNFWVTSTDNGDGTWTLVSRAILDEERTAIEVVIEPLRVNFFNIGLFGDLDLGASGSVFTDSYDSDHGSYASQAVHTHPVTGHTYAGMNGDLGSNADITIRGSVTVLGDATPGPGHTVTINGGGVHIEGSTSAASQATPLQSVNYGPSLASSGPLSLSGGNLDLNSGSVRYDSLSLSGGGTITVHGDVTLYVDGDVDVSGTGQVIIEPGGKLTIHHGSETFKLTGNGVWNKNQDASALVLYSEATLVKVAGTSGFYGAIYAPRATIEPVGTSQVYGSMVGSMIYVGGTADFHFDEALARDPDLGVEGAMQIVSWRRVPFDGGGSVSGTGNSGGQVTAPPTGG